MAVTLYAAGPPGDRRPALDALRRVVADRGGLSGVYRVTLSWQAVPAGAPRQTVLAAARRAVEDPRAVGYVDATGGATSIDVVQLLNTAGVAVAHVEDEGLRGTLCTGRDPYPSGRRTAAVPPGSTPADRATATAEALFDVLEALPATFDRPRITAALVARLGRC